MRTEVILVAAALGMLVGCSTTASRSLDVDSARTAEKLEVQIDEDGSVREIEYHIRPDAVPMVVQQAMRRLHPNISFSGAEREIVEGSEFWELAGNQGGLNVEAMFYQDGSLYEEEVQVRVDNIPMSVQQTVRTQWPGAQVTAWEEIRDSDRQVYEYHVKLRSGGMSYKATLGTDGALERVVREVPAELEIPVSFR